MKHTVTGQSDRPHRSPAATRDLSRSSTPASVAFTDNRPEAIAQRKLADAVHNSPYVVAQRMQFSNLFGEAAQLAGLKGLEEEKPLQGKLVPIQRMAPEEELQMKIESSSGPPAQRPNKTGLPDNLKSGIEALSGLSMDHVTVHYNSSHPAQLNALAYARGSDIHVAPGQEHHLPHEAWHVVQQAQGRVQPTMQMKEGVPVNDDKGLEHEADVMGAKASVVGQPAVPLRLFQGRSGQADARPQRDAHRVPREKGPLNVLSPTQQRPRPGGENIVQRAEKWWSTNAEHTAVQGAESNAAPQGPHVKREKAGASDELLPTQGDAWTRAKDTSLSKRPNNTALFKDTSEKMPTNDGDRTYLTTKEKSNSTVTIVVTHTKDPQSQVETEQGETLKVTHAHSASGNFTSVNKALKQGKHPKYADNLESQVHYLSLTPQ